MSMVVLSSRLLIALIASIVWLDELLTVLNEFDSVSKSDVITSDFVTIVSL